MLQSPLTLLALVRATDFPTPALAVPFPGSFLENCADALDNIGGLQTVVVL
jgi:hypothetical protein